MATIVLAPLKDEPCGKLVRLRRDGGLYRHPGPHRGRGRPRVHAQRFAFKEPETWGEGDEVVELADERWVEVHTSSMNSVDMVAGSHGLHGDRGPLE